MKSPCRYPGCRALLDKSGYCAAHKSSSRNASRDYDRGRRKKDPALAEARRIRSSARWRKVRLLVLSDSPLCADPFRDHDKRGTTETAKQVHHIQGLASRPDLAFTWSNLMPVCTRCHARLEQEAKTPRHDQQDPPEAIGSEWCPFG